MVAPSVHSFPASHALQLVAVAERFGVDAQTLLAPFKLSVRALEAPDARVPAEALRGLTERTRELTGEPGIGFLLGLQKRLSAYGYLGFAGMTASTVREFIELLVRYTPAITSGLSVRLEIERDVATIHIEERVDLGSARDVAVFSLLVGMLHLSALQTGRQARRVEIDIPFAKPDYFDRFAHLLPGVRFERPALRIRFPARGLDVALKTPDRAAFELAKAACERQLQELGGGDSLSRRVRSHLEQARSIPAITEVARGFGLSTRTLKRRLADEELTFSTLIDGERRERAQRLLRSTELGLSEIAEQLDYSTAANFARAFRRWTGQTPAQYRKQRR